MDTVRALDSIPSMQARRQRIAKETSQGRDVLNGILWVLRTGAPWKDLPPRYPHYQTCHRWFQAWVRQGNFKQIFTELGEDFYKRGDIDIRETFIDGSFTPAKNKESLCWPYKAWQGDQDHGNRRRFWSSYRH